MQNIHLSISAKSKNSILLGWSLSAWKQNRQDIPFTVFYRSICAAMLGFDFINIPYNTRRAKKRLALKK
jgi:hypothetical protein